MRECLGWQTSCENDTSCPQNWLEHAVTDLPVEIRCHVCEREVALVDSEGGLSGRLAAFPVVPPIALGDPPEVSPAEPAPDPLYAVEPREPTPVPAQREWVCTLANGDSIRVDKPSMTIGRSRTCDIVVPSAKVSRQHASVSLSGGELWIEDLGSANGVWHDGEKVTRTKVANGDTFTISDETLLFEVH